VSTSTLLKFRLHYEDGTPPALLKCTARDVLMWERTGKGKVFQELVRSQAMVDLYRIAHIAATRQGIYQGDLRSFEGSVDLENLDADEAQAEEQDDDEGSGDPTQSAQ
jgi:hypothetical protein